MRAKLSEVPVEVRRRAARHLEAIRGTPLARGGDGARLGDEACPVYRPDVKGIAYWEIEVVGVEPVHEDAGRPGGARGFVVVSTGGHDVPIPHWSLEREPPSRRLEAQSRETAIARVVKLDALAYVAEDARGTYLTHLGQFPPLAAGAPHTLPGDLVVSSLESRPTAASKSDAQVSAHGVRRTGTRAPRQKLAAWKSWAQVKREFAAAYRLQLLELRRRAAALWEVEALVAKLGEGIHEGDRIVVPLLRPGKATISGDGAASVTMRQLDRDPPAVELLALGAEKKTEQEFRLELAYDDGSSETLPFFVVPAGTPSNRRRTPPHPVPVRPAFHPRTTRSTG